MSEVLLQPRVGARFFVVTLERRSDGSENAIEVSVAGVLLAALSFSYPDGGSLAISDTRRGSLVVELAAVAGAAAVAAENLNTFYEWGKNVLDLARWLKGRGRGDRPKPADFHLAQALTEITLRGYSLEFRLAPGPHAAVSLKPEESRTLVAGLMTLNDIIRDTREIVPNELELADARVRHLQAEVDTEIKNTWVRWRREVNLLVLPSRNEGFRAWFSTETIRAVLTAPTYGHDIEYEVDGVAADGRLLITRIHGARPFWRELPLPPGPIVYETSPAPWPLQDAN